MSDFKDDRAAFEAATPGEWKIDEHGEEMRGLAGEGRTVVVTDSGYYTTQRDLELIRNMHSTYLPRMARIEELETRARTLESSLEWERDNTKSLRAKIGVLETCIPALNDTVSELERQLEDASRAHD